MSDRDMQRDPEFFEREYNARLSIPEHPQIFARWAERGAATRRARECLIDLQFGDAPGEMLDLFPARREAPPLLVFIHGGYWRSLDKSDFSWIAPPFVQHGVSVALTNYDLAPRTSIEDIVRQQLKAMAWLYRNADRLGYDPERIVLAGHSAGGHLVAMMMAALWPTYSPELPSTLIKGGLAISGLYDLEPLVECPFVNVDLGLDRRRARALSVIRMPPATSAPLLTSVGQLESNEFKRQSVDFGRAWRSVFQRHIVVAGRNHLSVMDELAEPGSPLFDAALQLIREARR